MQPTCIQCEPRRCTSGGSPSPRAPRREPPPSPFKLTSNFWSRYEARAGQLATGALDGRGTSDKVFYRARVGIRPVDLDLGNDHSTSFYFEPQAAGAYDGSGLGSDVAIGLHQGFLSLSGEAFRLDVGRFEMVYGDHLVIGNVGWHQAGQAFNGARARIAPIEGGVWLDLFATLMDKGSVPTDQARIGSLDYYFLGAYAGLGPMIDNLDLDFYLLSKIYTGGTKDGQSTSAAANGTLGTRVKGKAAQVDYRLEAGFQFGNRKATAASSAVSSFAYQADAELGVTPLSGLRLAGGGFIASGDDPATADTDEGWDQLFPTAHKFLGLSDIMGKRTNVAGAVVRGSYGVSKTLTAGADAHFFVRPEVADGTDSYAGTELNLSLAWKFLKTLKLRGMYGLFMPNGTGPLANGKRQHYLEIELSQTFK